MDREVDLALLRAEPAERFLALGETSIPEVGRRVVFGGFLGRADERTGGATLRFKHGTVASLERRHVLGARRTVGRAVWKDFPGFTADVAVNHDGAVHLGKVEVSDQGKVKPSLEGALLTAVEVDDELAMDPLTEERPRELAELVRTKKVTSLGLTEMYLARLKRFDGLFKADSGFPHNHSRTQI